MPGNPRTWCTWVGYFCCEPGYSYAAWHCGDSAGHCRWTFTKHIKHSLENQQGHILPPVDNFWKFLTICVFRKMYSYVKFMDYNRYDILYAFYIHTYVVSNLSLSDKHILMFWGNWLIIKIYLQFLQMAHWILWADAVLSAGTQRET